MVTGGIFGLGTEGYILAIIKFARCYKMKINKDTIKELSEYLNEFNLTEIEYTDKDTKIKVSKTSSTITTQTPIQTTSISETSLETSKNKDAISGVKVTSPIIGAAYHAPEPGAKNFLK